MEYWRQFPYNWRQTSKKGRKPDMKKRILAFLTAVLFVALLTVPVMAAEGNDSPARPAGTFDIDDNEPPLAAPVEPETTIEDADAPLAAPEENAPWTPLQTTAAVAGAVGVTAVAGSSVWLFTAYKAGRLGARGLKFVNMLKGLKFWK